MIFCRRHVIIGSVRALALLATVALAARPAAACLWDHDTLAEESLGAVFGY